MKVLHIILICIALVILGVVITYNRIDYFTMDPNIPKTIHFNYFGWDKKGMPDLFKVCLDKTKVIHPDFKLEIHGKEAEALISTYKNQKLSTVYDKVERRVMKSDIVRLLLIYNFGGFYMDLDIDSKNSLNECFKIYPNKKVFLFTETPKDKINTRIANYAFGGAKNHPFFELCLELLIDRNLAYSPLYDDLSKIDDDYVIWATGPDITSHATHLVFLEHTNEDLSKDRLRYKRILDKINRNDIQIVDKKSADFLFHHIATGTWR